MEHYVIKPAGEAGEAAVHAGLRAYNRTFVSDTADLSLVVEDEAGQIIGGCDAFRMGELALLDVLWVAESRRGTGLGACLLAQLEQDAARQGAKRLELNTFGFQAPGFYEKLGYRRFGAGDAAGGESGPYFSVKELNQNEDKREGRGQTTAPIRLMM